MLLRSTNRRRFTGTSLLSLAALATSCSTSTGDGSAIAGTTTLYFSAIPDDNKSELAEKYGLIANHLATELGVPVEYKPSASYEASVEAFKNGDVQLAWFGGVSGVKARSAVEGSAAIAQGKVDPQYVSYFIAHKDSGIEPGESFPDLAGKKFTFGPRGSTSGRLMPTFFIQEFSGKTPEELFGSFDFSTGHDNTAERVASGAFDAGAMSYKTYDRMVAEGKIDPAVCVKVWTTPTYADYNWTAHPELEKRYGAGFTARLQETLVSITDPTLLKALQREEGMMTAKNEDFVSIHETMVALDMFR